MGKQEDFYSSGRVPLEPPVPQIKNFLFLFYKN
jgi:uncharacterized protein YbgA (DUF1722 family)